MRMGIVSAVVVISVGIVGLAFAQQTARQPNDQTSAKAKLRAQVIKLRVEVELLELEHDATRAEILETIKDIRGAESQDHEGLKQLALSFFSLTNPEPLAKLAEKEGADKAEKEMNQAMNDAVKKTLDAAKSSRESRKKEYARQAEELAGKRLALAEIDKRYSDLR
jgi:hypothetical protein